MSIPTSASAAIASGWTPGIHPRADDLEACRRRPVPQQRLRDLAAGGVAGAHEDDPDRPLRRRRARARLRVCGANGHGLRSSC